MTTNDEKLTAILHTLTGVIPTLKLASLAEAEKRLSHANMQLGLSAQVQANSDKADLISAIVKGIPEYYKSEALEKITKAIS